jgi:hypothetical protein
MRSRAEIPHTKIAWSLPVSPQIVEKAWKRERPDLLRDRPYDYRYVVHAMTSGGMWLEMKSEIVFWMHRYYEVPRTVAGRFSTLHSLVESW